MGLASAGTLGEDQQDCPQGEGQGTGSRRRPDSQSQVSAGRQPGVVAVLQY